MNPLTKRAAAAITAAVLVLAPSFVQAQPAHAAGCANEAIRAEQGAAALALPDCRAYELVSPDSTPLVSSSNDVSYGARAANDGDAMAYYSYYPFQGAPSSGRFFRARRGPAGWSLEAMSPQVAPGAMPFVNCELEELDYSDDLSASVLTIGRNPNEQYPGGSFCTQPQEQLVPGEPTGFSNLLQRGAPGAPYQLINLTPPAASPANAQFQDASEDLSHVVFGEDSVLTPEAPPGYDLYLWEGGSLRLVTFLPDGTPVRGDLAGATGHRVSEERPGEAPVERLEGGEESGAAPYIHAVSSDGEFIFFYAQGNLYLRENAGRPPAASPNCLISESTEPDLACTLQVDAPSQTTDPPGGGVFQYASADGSRVFFTDESRLTSNSTAAPGRPDLYERVVGSGIADRTAGASGGADVLGVSGGSEDGTRLYFVAEGALTGTQENSLGEVAQSGQSNLYLVEDGRLTFVGVSAGIYATRTSPDGRYIAFNSKRGPAGGSTEATQIFLYDAESQTLSCASCLPGGAAPPGASALTSQNQTTEANAPGYKPRGLTDSGQLFFTTNQSLLPADTNSVADVYEYGQGALHLISDGTGAEPSFLFDTDVDGSNVFFATADPLVRSDTDNALTLYDARVGGGFAEPAAPASPCSAAESCRTGGPGAPATGTAATATATDPGNVQPPKACKHGKVRRHGKCVKRPRHPKHRKHTKTKTSRKSHGKQKGSHR